MRSWLRPALAMTLLQACVYYNAMWNAERLANEAGRLERRGRDAEARIRWAQAGVRAESVYIRHPASRWADDAMLLHGRALREAGNCARAAGPLGEVERATDDDALREEARLLLGECRGEQREWTAAESLLTPLLRSRDGGRADRARFWLGRAAAARGDVARGLDLLAHTPGREALLARVRLSLGAGDRERAAGLVDTLTRYPFWEQDWTLLDSLGGDRAAALVDRLAADRHVPSGARARLLAADGGRWAAAGDSARARSRWTQAVEAAPDSIAGGEARVALARLELAAAETPEALLPIRRQLARAAPVGGAPAQEAQRLLRAIELVARDSGDEVAAFVRAEVARDTLGAPRLAGRLFADLARRWPNSLFAPKALIAAAALDGDDAPALLDAARARYPQSPYVRALAGDPDPAFAVAEDSLRAALGLAGSTASAPELRGGHPPPASGPRTVLDMDQLPVPTPGEEPVPVRPRPAERDRPPPPASRPSAAPVRP